MIRASSALVLLLFRHWARASLPNRASRDRGRRVSAGLFRLAYFAMMIVSGWVVGRHVARLETAEQRLRGGAWMVVGVIGLAIVWSGLGRGPTLRGEPSPLETRFLDTLPIRESSRLVVGLVERLFVYGLGGSSLVGLCPGTGATVRATVAAIAIGTASIAAGEAMMRLARIVLQPMSIARARSYVLVLGQLFFLMCTVQAPSLGRSVRLGVLVTGWPTRVARALELGPGFGTLLVGCTAGLVASLVVIVLVERVGYDRVDLVPTARPRRSRRELLVVDRIDDVLRKREPGGRWSTVMMMAYTTAVTAAIVAFSWGARKASVVDSPSMVRGACGLAALGAFIVVSARASRMATRDVAARPLLAPLPIEPRVLLGGKVERLRRDALVVAAPLLALLGTSWSIAFHVEIAWRVGAVLLGVALAAKAAASIAFLTVGAGSKKGPLGSFVIESVLVLVPLIGIASAQYAFAVVVPLAALGLIAREAGKSGLGVVRWLDDGEDFDRETPIWRALLVLGAFQSAQALTIRIAGLGDLDEGTKAAVSLGASCVVLLVLTAHARRDAPSMRLVPERRTWLGVGLLVGLASGAVGAGYFVLLRRLGVPQPVTEARVALALATIGLAPFAEEVFFRGWLLPCIEEEVAPSRRRWLAPSIAAFGFAAVHPPIAFVPMFALGLGTSLLYSRTRALGPGIAAHLVHAALVVAIA